jgi:hypothetical protein
VNNDAESDASTNQDIERGSMCKNLVDSTATPDARTAEISGKIKNSICILIQIEHTTQTTNTSTETTAPPVSVAKGNRSFARTTRTSLRYCSWRAIKF